ncbi:MAG TPA: transglycosylase SLT domain-containing protein, partial [Blastocatellia bacterium]|nr:transglycosylase SLT domain-containing protein [Blastocatellia bacterium]
MCKRSERQTRAPKARAVALRAFRRGLIPVLCFFTVFQAGPLNQLVLPRGGTGALAAATDKSDAAAEELHALVINSSGHPAEADLLRIEARYRGSRAGELARFLRGYLHYGGQDYQKAVDALDIKAIGGNCSLGDYVLYYRALSEAADNQYKEAMADFDSVSQQYTDSLMARDARLGAAQMALNLGNGQAAVRMLSRMVETGDAGAAFVTAQAFEQMNKTQDAISLYRKIYYGQAATMASVKSAQRLEALNAGVAAQSATLEDERRRADGLFDAKQYAEALKAYDDLNTAYPRTRAMDSIQIRRGICLLNTRQMAAAATAFEGVTSNDPNIQAEALQYRAEALLRGSSLKQASAVVDRLVTQHRDSHWASTALFNLAAYLDKHDARDAAAVRYKQLLSVFPRSEHAPEASYALGWNSYRDHQYADAARVLEQHLADYRYPDSKFMGESGFWAAKAEEHLGNKKRALTLYNLVIARYRYGYDGFCAARRVAVLKANSGITPETVTADSTMDRIRRNLTEVQPVVETATGSESGRVSRADDLELLGLTDLAIAEMNQALTAAPTSPKLNLRLARIYARTGETFQATLTLRRAYPDLFSYKDSDLPRAAWEIFFPLKYWDTIKQEARRHGIDPYIAAGLIRQESVFNPNAISRVGARGLMQLMTPTAQLAGKREGETRITGADLYNPILNIKLGMNFLAQVIGEFGRIEFAAAAYNAGAGRAKQWIAQHDTSDIDEWVENIPFTETRGY